MIAQARARERFRILWQRWGEQELDGGSVTRFPHPWYRACNVHGKRWWTWKRLPPPVILYVKVKPPPAPRRLPATDRDRLIAGVRRRARDSHRREALRRIAEERRANFLKRQRERAIAACGGILDSLDR